MRLSLGQRDMKGGLPTNSGRRCSHPNEETFFAFCFALLPVFEHDVWSGSSHLVIMKSGQGKLQVLKRTLLSC